jgi:hypothetical protein
MTMMASSARPSTPLPKPEGPRSLGCRLVHLRYVLKGHTGYFMKRRHHQALKQQVRDSREEPPMTGCIRFRPVLGGLINDYSREA